VKTIFTIAMKRASNRFQCYLLKVADGDEPGAGADREFVFFWTPLDAGRRTVDTQQHQRVTPSAVRLRN
jgi:hypothetical protein